VGLLDIEEGDVEEIVLAGEGEGTGPYAKGTFHKIGTGMATLVALVLATYLVPTLDWARPWTRGEPVPFWNLIGREILGESTAVQQVEQQQAEADALAQASEADVDVTPIADREVIAAPEDPSEEVVPDYVPHEDDALDVTQRLELPDPNALDGFFARLARTETGYEGAITRVTHWGDSVLGTDNVTSTLREKMQRRFGDAGHGFHLMAPNNPSYRHKGVRFSGGDGWGVCHIIVNCKKDGHYGLGATTFWSKGKARSKFATSVKAVNGRSMSRFELWYTGKPDGGPIAIKVDGQPPVVLDTVAPALEDRWHTVQMEDGPHSVEVRTEGKGRARVYGVVMERDAPGVVWDGMSQVGAFTNRMLLFDPEHLKRQLAHRDPGLVVLQFGGNDLTLRPKNRAKFPDHLAQMIRNFRGEEKRACLVISPVDHGLRKGQRVESAPEMEWVTTTMREVALAEGCAFFDTQAAMGGPDSVAIWRKATPPLIPADLAHLTQPGQRALGQIIYLALMEAYRAYRTR
jgi:lysophospholipase L1-like esterase